MCDRCSDLEQYADDLREELGYVTDGLARALNTDLAGVARFLCDYGKDGLVPYLPTFTALDEQFAGEITQR